MLPDVGLTMTAGGARGAYQAGVLAGIADIIPEGHWPFPYLSGVSAGSINCAFLGAHAHDFRSAARELAALWSGIQYESVFATHLRALAGTGMAWLTDLGLGGMLGTGRGKSLLTTGPLRALLKEKLDMRVLGDHLRQGRLKGVAITATNYQMGQSVTFFDGHSDIVPWYRSTRIAVREELRIDHVLASAAIPVFFPAVKIGRDFYGDGCVRMATPLSPCIHMGAGGILAIGVRHQRLPRSERDLSGGPEARYPYFAQIAGVLMNAMFLDALESDMERVTRINSTLAMIPPEQHAEHPSKLRPVNVMAINPSQDLGRLAATVVAQLPPVLKYFLRGLGASEEVGQDLLSYMAFDAVYTGTLVSLGYDDAMKAREDIRRFLSV